MQAQAKVVVVGGGSVGAATLYGLARHGCADAVLLEKSQLTAGSTWHAAGLLVTFVRSTNISKMTMETIQIYKDVEKRLGASAACAKSVSCALRTHKRVWTNF